MEKQIAEIATSLKHITKTLDDVKAKGNETHEAVIRLDERGKVVNKRIDNLEEISEDLVARKNKQIGVLVSLGAIFGFIGSQFSAVISGINKIFGH